MIYKDDIRIVTIEDGHITSNREWGEFREDVVDRLLTDEDFIKKLVHNTDFTDILLDKISSLNCKL